jgi:2-keto-4-pentenoate hydratase/2-oxohepta-3-ene-1,7-dioic acid hydratase in catechol pathway
VSDLPDPSGPSQRFIRFRAGGDPTPRWGRREGGAVVELSAAPWEPGCRDLAERAPEGLVLLAPAQPSKLLALAYNYRDLFADPAARTSAREPHYSDPGFEPLVFLKGPNCLLDPGAPIPFPRGAAEVWVEVEVTAVIGRRVRGLRDAAAAREAIFGVTIGNDVTALNVLGRDWHLARSKSLDGFCPLGPELVRGFDDAGRALSTTIYPPGAAPVSGGAAGALPPGAAGPDRGAGRRTQSSTTANRVLDTFEAVVLASRLMTLEPGDCVLTGTPGGARQSLVRPGDTVELAIEGLGVLVNPVELEPHHG